MLILNTTYSLQEGDEKSFLAFLNDFVIPKATEDGKMTKGRILRVLSRQEEGPSYCLQLYMPCPGDLHAWYLKTGTLLDRELRKVFHERVIGFQTLMEEVEP